jgi:hypothetical protein
MHTPEVIDVRGLGVSTHIGRSRSIEATHCMRMGMVMMVMMAIVMVMVIVAALKSRTA